MIDTLVQQALNALQLGSYYSLIALGYCLVYGVLLLINFAHGDIFMVGAYIAFFAATFFLGQHALIPRNVSPMAQWLFIGIFAMILTACVIVVLDRLPGERLKHKAVRPVVAGVTFVAACLLIHFGLRDIAVAKGSLSNWVTLAATVPLTMLLTAALGVFTERVAYRPLRRKGASRLYVVITALMVGIILEYGNLSALGASRKFFPSLVKTSVIEIGGASMTNLKLTAIGVAFAVFGLLQWIVTKTKLGMAMRAVSYDKFAVPLMGIPLDTVIVFTFSLGSGMAGLAGMLYSMNYPVLDPLMGALVGWKAFVAAVVGGIGDIRGAFVGGFLLAFLEIAVAAVFSSEMRDLISFTILLGILTWKPTGLFGMAQTTKI